MNKKDFQSLVRRLLNEEVKKRVPEMTGNGIDSEKKNTTFSTDPNPRDTKSKESLEAELRKAVENVDKAFIVVWNDHDDLTVHAGDLLKLTITPLWEDTYKIVYMPRNEDRLFFTGLTWKQVLDFVKDNLDPKGQHTGVEKARDKAWRNREDQVKASDKGMPQGDKLSIKKVTDTKNKEKDYNEKAVKREEDFPERPMKEVGDIKRQKDHKVKDPVKLRKRVPDKKLVVKQ